MSNDTAPKTNYMHLYLFFFFHELSAYVPYFPRHTRALCWGLPMTSNETSYLLFFFYITFFLLTFLPLHFFSPHILWFHLIYLYYFHLLLLICIVMHFLLFPFNFFFIHFVGLQIYYIYSFFLLLLFSHICKQRSFCSFIFQNFYFFPQVPDWFQLIFFSTLFY